MELVRADAALVQFRIGGITIRRGDRQTLAPLVLMRRIRIDELHSALLPPGWLVYILPFLRLPEKEERCTFLSLFYCKLLFSRCFTSRLRNFLLTQPASAILPPLPEALRGRGDENADGGGRRRRDAFVFPTSASRVLAAEEAEVGVEAVAFPSDAGAVEVAEASAIRGGGDGGVRCCHLGCGFPAVPLRRLRMRLQRRPR